MRVSVLALAVLLLTHGVVQADPPAKLGVPIGSAATETPRTLPIPPGMTPDLLLPPGKSDVLTIPPPSLAAPPVFSPGVLSSVGPELPPMGGPGYPSSFPPPSIPPGLIPPGRGMAPPGMLPPGAMPPGAMHPGAMAPGATAQSVLPPGSSMITLPGKTLTPNGPMNSIPFPGTTLPASGSVGGPEPIGTSPIPMEPGQGMHGTGPCGPIRETLQGKQPPVNPYRENLSFFHGLSTAHEPIDLGINSRFGYRFHLHWGLPLVEEFRLGLHLGVGYNYGNNMQRTFRLIGLDGEIHQTFFTAGLFQRNERMNWEIAWDFRADDYYEHFNASQWRGLVSYNLNAHNEVGVWGTYRDRSDSGRVGATVFNVRAMNQVNFFWKHTWDMQIVTTLWAGFADQHGKLTLGGPIEGDVHCPFSFGGDLFVPLSDKLAIVGEAKYITPNDSGTVVATLGIAWYPGGRPATQVRSPFSPLLPTASNASFTLDAQR